MSSGHLLLSGDGLGLGFWVMLSNLFMLSPRSLLSHREASKMLRATGHARMVMGYGFGVRGRKVKSRDCALASDLVRAPAAWAATSGKT